ncbi:hypothetical protein AB0C27_40570 [Nonomuraea sp. NPDC048882]|uniref:hypothetical protein n=1 Tax=Nonomuraea sp. NPDC048882 TaxID=3154347 RepID=UPI00340AE8A8
MTTFMDAFHAERNYAAAKAKTRPPRTSLVIRAGRAAAKLLPRWQTIRTLTLSVAGFGLITAAAWTLHLAAGLAVGGISLLILESLTGSERR